MRPDKIIKQVNIKLKKDEWAEMTIVDMLEHMVENKQHYALVKNNLGKIAMVTIHETQLQPTFMESCATVYILEHIEPEIKCGVCGMIYTKNNSDTAYIITVKQRDKLLRFPNDGWTFN